MSKNDKLKTTDLTHPWHPTENTAKNFKSQLLSTLGRMGSKLLAPEVWKPNRKKPNFNLSGKNERQWNLHAEYPEGSKIEVCPEVMVKGEKGLK